MSYSKQIISCHSGTKHRARNCCWCFRNDAAGRENAEVPPLQIRCTHVQTHAPRFGQSVPLARPTLMSKPKHVPKCWVHRSPPLFAGCVGKTTAQTRRWRRVPSCQPCAVWNRLLNFQKIKATSVVLRFPSPNSPGANMQHVSQTKSPLLPELKPDIVTIQPAPENLY